MIEYELGQAVRITAAFVNAAGAAADPTTVSIKYGVIDQSPPPDPTATVLTFAGGTVTKDSVGNYHADFVPAVPGDYIYQAVGTGTVAAVARGRFRVLPSPFA